MSDHQSALVLPARLSLKTRIFVRESEGRIELTDRGGSRLAYGFLLAITFGVGGLTLVFSGTVWLLQIKAQPAPPPFPLTVKSGDEFAAILLMVAGGLLLVAWPVLLGISGLHRGFRVRVDCYQLTCLIENRYFGLPLSKREADLKRAEWGVDSVRHPFVIDKETTWTSTAASIILLFMGPLGSLIALFMGRGRRSNRGRVVDIEVMRLWLKEAGDTLAIILVPDESVAVRFLLAWDRMVDGRSPKR